MSFDIFVVYPTEHLKEEELELAPQIRKHMTPEDHVEAVQKIVAGVGPENLQIEIPAVTHFTKIWATDEYYPVFLSELPPPLLKVNDEVFVPNYHSYSCKLRDAPTLSEKPALDKLPFDMSMMGPPPEAAS